MKVSSFENCLTCNTSIIFLKKLLTKPLVWVIKITILSYILLSLVGVISFTIWSLPLTWVLKYLWWGHPILFSSSLLLMKNNSTYNTKGPIGSSLREKWQKYYTNTAYDFLTIMTFSLHVHFLQTLYLNDYYSLCIQILYHVNISINENLWKWSQVLCSIF